MANDKKTRLVEPEHCLSVSVASATPSSQKRMASKPHRGDEASRPWNQKKAAPSDRMELLKKARLKRALSQRVAGRRRYASKPNPVPASASSANVLGSGTIVIVNVACGRLLSLKS